MIAFAENSAAMPTQASERLLVLDALRGFALLGIMFVNYTWFSGFAVQLGANPERVGELGTLELDTIVHRLVVFLVEAKFWSMFAFLFGAGLGMQWMRFDDRPFGMRSTQRRLAILLFVGLAHGIVVWFGDIVSLYAVTGFVLLLFRRVPTPALLRCGLFFLALPVLQGTLWLMIYSQLKHGGSPPPDLGHGPPQMLPSFATGNALQVVEANGAYFVKRWILAIYEGRFFKLLGMFLLGCWAARNQWFVDSTPHRKRLYRIMGVGLAIGIPTNWFYATTGGGVVLPVDAQELIRIVNQCIGVPAMACAYVALFLLVFAYQPRLRLWSIFAPVGRMSLTNYVMQSVIGVALFYGCGLGMWGEIGITWSLAVIGTIYCLQSIASFWWLRIYRFGPLEWFCRSLTYQTILPLRKQPKVNRAIAVSKEQDRRNLC